jgi:hypothetical protein
MWCFSWGWGRLDDRNDFDAEFVEQFCGEALFRSKDAEEEMLCADVLVAEAIGLFGGVGEGALGFIREWAVGVSRDRNPLFATVGVRLNLLANGVYRSVLWKELIGKGRVFAEDSEEEMFGFYIGGTKDGGLVFGEEDNTTRFFGISVEHLAEAPMYG